jgi:hypothetical protein
MTLHGADRATFTRRRFTGCATVRFPSSIVRSQSRNGSHNTFAAARPAVIPTCPAPGSTSVTLGSSRASANADSGGTM